MDLDGANDHRLPKTMNAWVLGEPEEPTPVEKPVPELGAAEVLARNTARPSGSGAKVGARRTGRRR